MLFKEDPGLATTSWWSQLPLWSRNHLLCKGALSHHLLSPPSHNSWSTATRCEFLWPSQTTLETSVPWRLPVLAGKSHNQVQFFKALFNGLAESSYPRNICSGFRKAGVVPFPPAAIIATDKHYSPQDQPKVPPSNDGQENDNIAPTKCSLDIQQQSPFIDFLNQFLPVPSNLKSAPPAHSLINGTTTVSSKSKAYTS